MQPQSTQACVNCNSVKGGTLNSKEITPTSYEKLRRDVSKLEYEVQNFLDALQSDKSRVCEH